MVQRENYRYISTQRMIIVDILNYFLKKFRVNSHHRLICIRNYFQKHYLMSIHLCFEEKKHLSIERRSILCRMKCNSGIVWNTSFAKTIIVNGLNDIVNTSNRLVTLGTKWNRRQAQPSSEEWSVSRWESISSISSQESST